ncbi:IS66 family insertion sequence element accessory protein TnpA, partial [Salibacterium qingdaonense]
MDPVEYQETWRRRIAAFQESGLSVPQWCATQKNITIPQVRYWKKKFETPSSLPASSPSPSWVEMDVGSQGAPAPSADQA